MRKITVSANMLKILAVIAMIVDHTAALFLPYGSWLRMILRTFGRIAAPSMCYMIAEGYHHTSNRKRYMRRLLIFAIISHLPYNLSMGFSWSPLEATSVMWALAMGLAALMIVKREDIHWLFRLCGLGACCLLAYTANWNYIAVLWIVAFGIFHDSRKKQLIAFTVIGIVFHLGQQFLPLIRGILSLENFRQWNQMGIFLVVPLLAVYDGSRRCKSKLFSMCFYLAYPVHLLILYLVKMYLS